MGKDKAMADFQVFILKQLLIMGKLFFFTKSLEAVTWFKWVNSLLESYFLLADLFGLNLHLLLVDYLMQKVNT